MALQERNSELVDILRAEFGAAGIGAPLTGQEWQGNGTTDMVIDLNRATTGTLYVRNDYGSEVANLDVENNIVLGGTIDGIDLASFKSTYDAHDHSASDPTQVNHAFLTGISSDQHHAQSHVLATTSGLGTDHTTSGLTVGYVLRASGATTAAFAQLSHADLASVTSDQHHAQSHVLADTAGLGSTHTTSGLTTGYVLRASGATTAAFAQLQHSDLGGVSSDQHHAQNHVLATNTALGPTHTISGTSSGQVLRASSSSAANFQQLVHSDLGTVTADQHHAGFIGLEDNAATAITPAADDRIQVTDDGIINADAGTNVLALSFDIDALTEESTPASNDWLILEKNAGGTFRKAQVTNIGGGHAQSHVIATTSGLGTDHTTSGLTAGQVLRATGATTAAFQALQASDLAAHVLATTSGLGSQHTTSGLTTGYVLRASGTTTAAFAQLAHSDLGTVTSDQHHAQNHVLATNTALGATHTISGASSGHVLRASSSSAANFQQLVHADLGTVTSDQHHAQNHVLASTSGLGATHTVSGLTAGQFLRATGATTAAFQTIQSSDLPTHASTHLPSGGDALTTAAPGADSVNLSASGTGSANSLARSDHTHNLDEAITPTWTGKHTFTNATAIEIDVATGDPVIIFDTQGADKFVMGVDDSVTGDPFVISSGGTLGTNNVLTIASTGEIELSTDSSIIWEERAAPSTPGSGKWKTYFKTDGMYCKDDAGVETGPFSTPGSTYVGITGEIRMWPTGSAPSGWLICDGSGLDTTTYADLYAVIGYTFGGSGSTFNLPDFRDRSPQGASATDAIAATVGTKMQTSLPQHSHQMKYRTGSGSTTVIDGVPAVSWGYISTENTGTAGGVDQRGPRLAVNFIIKT